MRILKKLLHRVHVSIDLTWASVVKQAPAALPAKSDSAGAFAYLFVVCIIIIKKKRDYCLKNNNNNNNIKYKKIKKE